MVLSRCQISAEATVVARLDTSILLAPPAFPQVGALESDHFIRATSWLELFLEKIVTDRQTRLLASFWGCCKAGSLLETSTIFSVLLCCEDQSEMHPGCFLSSIPLAVLVLFPPPSHKLIRNCSLQRVYSSCFSVVAPVLLLFYLRCSRRSGPCLNPPLNPRPGC
jgi:hypothetical protein